MAGRKKTGNLSGPVGVRLDAEIREAVERIAAESPLARNATGEVIRVIVTNWIIRSKSLGAEYTDAATRVFEWRKLQTPGARGTQTQDGGAWLDSVTKDADAKRRKAKKRSG